jgi:hypothetical protein
MKVRDLRSTDVQGQTDDQINGIIASGKGKMPAYEKTLGADSCKALVAYIRTLMPRGAKEEDGFLYLSDAFIRRLVGPSLKLTERRRVLCYNHLRMIGHLRNPFRRHEGRGLNVAQARSG